MRCPAHTIRSFDVRRSEAEGPLSGGQGNLVSLILLSGPREAIHESGMRENRTFRLSGGRRRALQWAPPPTRQELALSLQGTIGRIGMVSVPYATLALRALVTRRWQHGTCAATAAIRSKRSAQPRPPLGLR